MQSIDAVREPPAEHAATPPPLGPSELREMAAEVARLYPAIYQRLHGAGKPSVGADMTARMVAVVQHLAVAGPLTLSELVRHLGLSKPTTTALVNRLEARALVARTRDTRDRRRICIQLTDAGRAHAQQLGRIFADDVLAQVLAEMAPNARTGLVEGLRALARAAQDPGGTTMTTHCESCGMPLAAEATDRYCPHCTTPSGELQPFEERFERMVQWQMRQRGSDRPTAEVATREYMRTMPAWRDHPALR